MTFCVALFLMILVDKAALDDLWLALSRTVIFAFPASFSATVVDFVKVRAGRVAPELGVGRGLVTLFGSAFFA